MIEPPEPYGMPLNLTTLPQKLKEAGKIVVSCTCALFLFLEPAQGFQCVKLVGTLE